MQSHVKRKWRPSLALIICGAMVGIVAVPVLALTYFRVAGNILGWAETAWLIIWLALTSAAILGALLWRLVQRPVRALTDYAHAVKAGRMDAKPPRQFGTPEFSALGQSVIDMGETLDNRATGLRAYADHVTHELKSPLTAITGAAELLQGDMAPDDRAALASTIKEAAARMERLLADLRRHAQAGQRPDRGQADLGKVASKLTGLDVQVLHAGQIPMPEEDLHAALMQLTQNAVAHGATRVVLDWQEGTLSIRDNGTGVARGNQARVFDPFFTTTRAEGGTGMGLSIVSALVGAHGGKIALVPSAQGAAFEIVF